MKILTIFGIIVFISFQSFGQEITGFGTDPKGFRELENPTLPDFKKFSIEKNGGITIRSEGYTYARADPRMPIAVPPKDLYSKFLIKEIPKDFPSDMPVHRLEKDSWDLRSDK
jgi:hypothetical protein